MGLPGLALLARKDPKLAFTGQAVWLLPRTYKVRSCPLLLPHVETKRARCLGVGRVWRDTDGNTLVSQQVAGFLFFFVFLLFLSLP